MSQAGELQTNSPPIQNAYPITPYVVGPSGKAGYQTIQSAINAANAAGGGFIFVQDGTYLENLTLYPNISISGPQILAGFPGDPASCIIQGNHIPPTSGAMTFNNITFSVPSGDGFSSLAAGTAELNFTNAGCGVTDGYFLNIPNWTGVISFWDFNPGLGTNDGGIYNPTGGAPVFCFEAGVGLGTTHAMEVSGVVLFNQGEIMCPLILHNGVTGDFANDIFGGTITLSGNATAQFHHCYHSTGATPAITMSSSGTNTFANSVILSTNNPAISGSGAGTINLANITFINNANIAGTLTSLTLSTTMFGEVRAGADIGGGAGLTSLTNTNSATIGAGTGTVKMSSGNNANNAAWIKIYVGTTAYWIPAWTTNSP